VISISKIRNKIVIEKKWREKGIRGEYFGLKPHSNGDVFSRFKFNFFEITILRVSIRDGIIIIRMVIMIRKKIIYINLIKFFEWKSNIFFILYKYLAHQYIKINKNSQTTSTKCQYQAAASNPK
jgi:hypothetical protein